ncbi:MAG: glycoside hydrolase family 9 protein, partial [Spirochaetaceae bacterium]|nr:glycoside hydrolase family 9 protein [Spirochaetaceae bacterium]
IKIPDAYSREGFNAINLENFTWNTCVWEIDSIAHDRIEEVSFQIHRYGKELSGGEELFFEIKNICFEEVECDVVHGWQCANETVVFPRSGYFTEGKKTAIANTAASGFEILDANTGQRVFKGGIERVQTYHGSFGVLDFSPLETPGRYRIRFGDAETADFRIGDDLFEETIWRLVNFLFCERCGYPVPGKHGVCHGDVIAEHKGVKLAFQGGWHDAADVSQQTVQSAEITHALLETAEAVKHKNPLLYRRLVEEAAWGVDFVLRMRFGDGYRASNSAIRRWTDGLIGNFDDCEARTHNHSFENFIAAGVEAMAAKTFAETDRELAWKCREAAAEDFAFALDRFNETGLEAPLPQEHAGSASLSQFYAAALWSASLVHSVRPEEKLAEIASDFAEKLLCCQERDGIKTNDGAVVNGFFYRDETRKTIVHFSHQARDQLFVQALDAACSAFPAHQHRTQWEASMLLFGGYLKTISRYTAPYGMLPAGIYTLDEVDDREAFNAIHPTVSFDAERKNYIEQLESAIPLGNGAYIRCFPIWFSYRGNSAIHLSMGKAASIIGRRFADGALLQIAREQLYWTSGKNPFGQSLIYGEGSNYGQQYTALLGETVGEMPVGVQTRRNEDTPYWPQANIATYREVWTTPPGRWLWIAADLLA